MEPVIRRLSREERVSGVDATFWLNLLMRWLHVASAVVAIGGAVLAQFAVLPALRGLPNGAEILERIRAPFKRLIHASLGLLFLTGLYNYMIAIPKVRAAREQIEIFGSYHPVMGVKILLWVAMLALAVFMLRPVANLEENRRPLLSVYTLTGVIVLLIAAYLRRLWALI